MPENYSSALADLRMQILIKEAEAKLAYWHYRDAKELYEKSEEKMKDITDHLFFLNEKVDKILNPRKKITKNEN